MDTEPVAWGGLLEKWRRVKADIAHDLEVVEQCRANRRCPVPAQRLIDLASEGAGRSGRARIGLINGAVNFAITPVSDEAQWGVLDRWSGPLETLRSRRGDCEDYAIVKYVALLEAGLSKEDLKIVILKNRLPNEDHAAVAARVDGQWLILDNRTLTLVRDVDLARAIPRFALEAEFLASPRLSETTCLIADVHMPAMTGIELYQRLVDTGHAIPTILVTAFPNDADRARALNGGVTCYLGKPVDERDLARCLDAAFASSGSPEDS